MNSTEYSEKLKDPKWTEVRDRIIDRDKGRCCQTGRYDNLHVHHCHYEKGEPWDTPDEFLVTLEGEQHWKQHEIETEIRRSLGRCIARISRRKSWDAIRRLEAVKAMLDSIGNELDHNAVDFRLLSGEDIDVEFAIRLASKAIKPTKPESQGGDSKARAAKLSVEKTMEMLDLYENSDLAIMVIAKLLVSIGGEK